LPDLPAAAHVIIDGADRVAWRSEAALFYLYNRLIPQGRLLLTASAAPRDWGLTLPDLLSRLQAMAVARLEAPDDALLAAVLVKLMADRQITPAANLIPYLLPRMERSIAAARALVAVLDARSLATQRPITRQLAAEVLDLGADE
jgi:chromosomal replication initiation ATPase DnaA